MDVSKESDLSEEKYVILKAKETLQHDHFIAKSWMITAKTLYPNNFTVQFEAYSIEKNAKHVAEAAKCFSDLIFKFQEEPELWKEIEKVTAALKDDGDTDDVEKQFLCKMFKDMSPDVQHKLLLCTADHCGDTMEHCRLLLMLLQRFPAAIVSYGPRLIDTLIGAEKHSHDGNYPLNPFRKLLVSELLPLLNKTNVKLDINQKLLLRLLHKSVEFYCCYLGLSTNNVNENEPKIDNVWQKLFSIIEFIGNQLEWDYYLINFTHNWSKESYWQKIIGYCQSRTCLDDKQLLLCVAIFFLHCLYEYSSSLIPESSPGHPQTTHLLVEAFVDSSYPNPHSTDLKCKKRRSEDGFIFPYISVEKPELKQICTNFVTACNCWELVNSSEYFQREFYFFNDYLKIDSLLSDFVIDYAIYKGKYDEALMYLQKSNDSSSLLQKYIRIAGILYIKKKFSTCFEHILLAIPLLPNINVGCLSNQLLSGGNQRHLHFLPISYTATLQYLIKLLLRSIKENGSKHAYNELAIGHILTLAQMDWPQEEEFVPPLMSQIQQHGSFNYVLFQNYIINIDILEEITYLCTNQGGQINLDILPHMGQRRIGTRGSDKGVKEEIRQIIKRQVTRCNENINELLIRFITHERGLILQTLI